MRKRHRLRHYRQHLQGLAMRTPARRREGPQKLAAIKKVAAALAGAAAASGKVVAEPLTC